MCNDEQRETLERRTDHETFEAISALTTIFPFNIICTGRSLAQRTLLLFRWPLHDYISIESATT